MHFNVFSLILPFLDPGEELENKLNALRCVLRMEFQRSGFFRQYYLNVRVSGVTGQAVRAFERLLGDGKRDVRRLAGVCINNWECL